MRRSRLLLPTAVVAAALAAVAVPAGAGASPAAPLAATQLRPAPLAAAGPAVPPVPGAVVRAFDPPASRYGAGHRGVDLAATPGTAVVAAVAGTVRFAGTVARVGWITVDHGGGLSTTYGPLAPRLVTVGQRVVAGQRIGRLASDGKHLDWGARLDGVYLDPLTLLGRWQVHLSDAEAGQPAPLVRPAGILRQPATVVGGRRDVWRPVPGPVTSPFGTRVHPVSGERRAHDGLDIAAATGTPVLAAAGGTVMQAGAAGGYGLLVVIDHGGGVSTRYAHLSRVDIMQGQTVAGGEAVGAVGSTGLSTGPHLHFELRQHGVARDPAAWLAGGG